MSWSTWWLFYTTNNVTASHPWEMWGWGWGCRFRGWGSDSCGGVCECLCSSDSVKQRQLSPVVYVPLLAHKASAPLKGGRQCETNAGGLSRTKQNTHTKKSQHIWSGQKTDRLSAKNIACLAFFISFATLEELLLVTLVAARRSIVGHCVAIYQILLSFIHSRCMPAVVPKCVYCLFCDDIISGLCHYLTSLINPPPLIFIPLTLPPPASMTHSTLAPTPYM